MARRKSSSRVKISTIGPPYTTVLRFFVILEYLLGSLGPICKPDASVEHFSGKFGLFGDPN